MSGAVSIGPYVGAQSDLASQASFEKKAASLNASLARFWPGRRSAWERLGPWLCWGVLLGVLLSASPLSIELKAADLAAPIITSFAPDAGYPGALVILNGSNLSQVVSIAFSGVAAPVYGGLEDGTAVQTQVPPGASSGPVTVVTAGGSTTSLQDFEVIAPGLPSITRFSPASGPVGTSVTIVGSNLINVASVQFHGVEADFSTLVELAAIVPTNASTGPITVTTKNGSTTTAEVFTVTTIGPPVVASFSPLSGPPGTTVTITGTNFAHVQEVDFGGMRSDSVGQMSGTTIWARVPLGGKSGSIRVVTETGSNTTSDLFTVTPAPAPVLTGFSPAAGLPGTLVDVSGQNLSLIQTVWVSGVEAEFYPFTDTRFSLRVPDAPSGPISVQTAGGTAKSAGSFIVIGGPPPPIFESFSPTNGIDGSIIVLRGTNLGVVRAVLFNGTPAEFERYPDQVLAVVPPFASSGPITIQSDFGTVVSQDSFTSFNSGQIGLWTEAPATPIVVSNQFTFIVAATNLSARAVEDLRLTNSFAAGPGTPSDLVIWTNAGPAFQGALPADLAITKITPSQGTATVVGDTVVCNSGRLLPGQTLTVSIDVESRAPQRLHLLSAAVGAGAEGQPVYAATLKSVIVTGSLELSVRPIAPGQVEVSWPLTDPVLGLQSTDSVLGAGNWSDVLAPVNQVNGRNVVLIPSGFGCQFYRLVQRNP